MKEAAPEDYNLPLTRWGRVWRLLLCLTISALAWAEIAGDQWRDHRALFWLDLAAGAIAFVLARYRRRWPLAIAIAVGILGAVSVSSAGPACLTMVSLATRRRLPEIITAGLVGIVAALVFTGYQPDQSEDPAWIGFAFLVVFTIAVVSFGMYVL